MDLNHLHLHVTDVERGRAFYETYFQFRERIRHGPILFLTNIDGFDLALAPDDRPTSFPDWFHFGFRMKTPDEVRSLHQEMTSKGIPMLRELIDDDDLVSFRCADPDGYGIEVYWE